MSAGREHASEYVPASRPKADLVRELSTQCGPSPVEMLAAKQTLTGHLGTFAEKAAVNCAAKPWPECAEWRWNWTSN